MNTFAPKAFGSGTAMSAAYVRDADAVTVVREPGPRHVAHSDCVFFHDLREVQKNRQFADEIDIGRRKLNDPRGPEVTFIDETLCLVRKANFELKAIWYEDTVLRVNGGADRFAHMVNTPSLPKHDQFMALRADPQRIPGKSVVLNGVGVASNYYHWIGEQMPKLHLLRMSGHLQKMQNLVVFVRQPTCFVPETVRLLFPEFTGDVVQVPGMPVTVDNAVFVVAPSLADRVEGAAKDPAPSRTAWGSLWHFSQYIDTLGDDSLRSDHQGSKVVLISRAKTDRIWVNEAEVMERLAPLGVTTIRTEDMTFRDQVAAMRQADLVIAQHGAGLANILFCRPGTKVIEITGRRHAKRSWDFAKLAVVRGLEFHCVVVDLPFDDPYAALEETETAIAPDNVDIRTGARAHAFITDMVRRVTGA